MALRREFEALVDRHYQGIWSYVSSLTGGRTETEDIVHQAFLLAFDRLAAATNAIRDPGSWLRGTARNLVYSWWRERRRIPQELADRLILLPEGRDNILTNAAVADLHVALADCLGQLKPGDRALLAKRYEDGLRITAIAEGLRENIATIRVRLFRIRLALKRCLQNRLSRGGVS